DLAAKREAGRKAGGKSRMRGLLTLPPDTPDLTLQSVADIVVLVGLTLNQTRRGQIDPKVANSLFYGASVLRAAIEQGELEQRIAAVEERTPQRARPCPRHSIAACGPSSRRWVPPSAPARSALTRSSRGYCPTGRKGPRPRTGAAHAAPIAGAGTFCGSS